MIRGLSFRRTTQLLSILTASAVGLACGGPNDTDFDSDDGSAGTSSGAGGSSQGGSSQGGSAQGGSAQGGSAQGGSAQGGSSQGGSDSGGSASGGTSQGGSSTTGGSSGSDTGGSSGTATGGGTTGGAGGTGGGGAGGTLGGTGPGGLGGASGRAGGGGKGGNDCVAIIASAQAALLAAQVCNPAQSSPRCTGKVEDLCGCTVPVNDSESTATKNYLAQREAAVRCGVPCLAITCREPTTPICGIGGVTTNIVVAQSHCAYSPR